MDNVKDVEVLALDLEGTLISNAMSQIARPGLREFLEFCGDRFPRLVILVERLTEAGFESKLGCSEGMCVDWGRSAPDG